MSVLKVLYLKFYNSSSSFFGSEKSLCKVILDNSYLLYTSRFQLMVPLPNHDVIKNLTGHRIHEEGPQIFYINHQINSLQNMYDML